MPFSEALYFLTHLAANSPYLQNAVSRPPTRTIRTFPNTPGFCEGVCCLCLTSNGDIGADIDVDVVDDVEGGEPKGGDEDTGGGDEEDISGVQLTKVSKFASGWNYVAVHFICSKSS